MEAAHRVNVTVHYYRYDGRYDGWSLWVWAEGEEGAASPFGEPGRLGRAARASVNVKPGTRRVGVLPRRSSETDEWAERDGGDRYVELASSAASEAVNVWLIQGRPELFASAEQAEHLLRQASAEFTDMRGIRASVAVPLAPDRNYGWELLADGRTVEAAFEALNADEHGCATAFRCAAAAPVRPDKRYSLRHAQRELHVDVAYGKLFDCPQFHERYTYSGGDLGCYPGKDATRFRLWAPTASEAFVMLYPDWASPDGQALAMARSERGTWLLSVDGDLSGIPYTYKVRVGDAWHEAADPYARAAAVNGDRSVVADPSLADPDGWGNDVKPPLTYWTDAIIYELHIRDFSIHPESGIVHKGRYLGLTEEHTSMPDGTSTGVAHVRELGVTHVQLLPVFDFSSVDERERDRPNYNWGYDPENYNVPDGAYAADPYDPLARIRELKLAILALHRNGLRVVMDVVYNHVYDAARSSLGRLVPGYYFRTADGGSLANGTGVGNDTASERPMMRKLMLDSIVYWAEEYHIDGFRFDLMGIHDVETMRAVRDALDTIDPSILIIGEGWNLNTPLPEERKAMQRNAGRMRGIGHFNDSMRDGLRGSAFDAAAAGFAGGNHALIEQVKGGVAGGIRFSDRIGHFAEEPHHCVNYAEAHDNHTLWDKLQLSNPGAAEDERIRMHMLATAIVLTSQGIPFLHAGQEFLRTKQGEENSYRSPDEINRLDWPRKARYAAVVEAVRGWIRLRRAHPALRLPDAGLIRRHFRFLDAPPGVLAYAIGEHAGGDPWHTLVIAHNASGSEQTVGLPFSGAWHVVCDGSRAGTDPLFELRGQQVNIPALASMALYADGAD